MNTIAFIINDVHFPYTLFEDAIECAKEHEATFLAIILTNEIVRFDQRDFYANVLDDFFGSTVQISLSQRIIAQHLRFSQQRAGACHLPFKSLVLTSPLLHQVIEYTREADRVFIDTNDEPVFEKFSFSKSELLRRLPKNIKTLHLAT